MKEVKIKKYKGSLILKLAIIASLVFVVFTLVNQQIMIGKKTAELDGISDRVKAQEIKNEEIKYNIEEGKTGDAKFAEEYARSELGYVKQGEKVFVNIGGN